MLTHLFSSPFSYLRFHFQESCKFLDFSCVLAHGSSAQSTKKKFLKKLYEDMRIELGKPSRILTFFHAYFRIYKPFFMNNANSSILCIYESGAQSTKIIFSNHFMRTSIFRWGTIMYSHRIFLRSFFIKKTFFRNPTNSSIFYMY